MDNNNWQALQVANLKWVKDKTFQEKKLKKYTIS